MATEYLGPLSISMRCADLIFPHHDMGDAQAEPVTGVAPFVRCWMHTACRVGGTQDVQSRSATWFLNEAYLCVLLRLHCVCNLELCLS
jgi:cysteinyl-tRNA synthetase